MIRRGVIAPARWRRGEHVNEGLLVRVPELHLGDRARESIELGRSALAGSITLGQGAPIDEDRKALGREALLCFLLLKRIHKRQQIVALGVRVIGPSPHMTDDYDWQRRAYFRIPTGKQRQVFNADVSLWFGRVQILSTWQCEPPALLDGGGCSNFCCARAQPFTVEEPHRRKHILAMAHHAKEHIRLREVPKFKPFGHVIFIFRAFEGVMGFFVHLGDPAIVRHLCHPQSVCHCRRLRRNTSSCYRKSCHHRGSAALRCCTGGELLLQTRNFSLKPRCSLTGSQLCSGCSLDVSQLCSWLRRPSCLLPRVVTPPHAEQPE
mmetsp:Transcript_15663/g.35089  ORF Transcript_15663/g.35089 Transcript_15663/m.35089 type:complete len:321 (+) Transcript_15663:812-1774(+)